MTFAANETEIPLTIGAIADGATEPTEGFRIALLANGTNYQTGWGGSWAGDTADVQITSNAPPVVEDDSYSTHNAPVLGQVVGYDPEGDSLAFTLAVNAAKGAVALNSDGTFTYTPNAGATGTDTFSVTGSDGNGGTDTGVVTIDFTNSAPTADPGLVATWPGQAVALGWTGYDADGDALAVSGWTSPQWVAGAVLGSGYGAVGYDAATEQFTYTPPDATWTGTVSFGYTVGDGYGGSASATATVNVLPAGSAAPTNDDYQLSADGTLMIAFDEGVLVNDFLPNSQTAAVLTTTLDPSIGTLTLNADGSFSVALTTAANATPDPVTFTYNVVSTQGGGGVIGTAVVKLHKSSVNFTLFRAREVTFGGAAFNGQPEIRPITPDDGGAAYASKQWLDKNADGFADEKNPIRFVHKNAGSVRVESVRMAPAIQAARLNLKPANYNLVGEVILNGTASGIVLQSTGPGTLDAKTGDWKFPTLTLQMGSETFPAVAYYPDMTIQWKLERIDQANNRLSASQTVNPAYITWAPISTVGAPTGPPASFKLLRTFVALGSNAVGGAPAEENTREAIIARVWSSFVAEDGTPQVQTWDGNPLAYYSNWNQGKEDSYGLVRKRQGDCTSFAKLFINALRAQGIEDSDDLYWIQPTKPDKINDKRIMFVGDWVARAGTGGAAKVVTPGFPALGVYRWWNASNDRPPWRQAPGGEWGYSFDVIEVDPPLTTNSQNNTNPRGNFERHVIVKIRNADNTFTFYDPSYGITTMGATPEAGLNAYEDVAIPYYGLYKPTLTTIGVMGYSLTYLMKQRPAPEAPPGIERLSGGNFDTNY